MDEEALSGQTNQGVVRVGNTVRRHISPWSPAVHELLEYLESVNFAYSPRFLGVDEKGREILTYIEGVSGKESWSKVVTDEGLKSFGKLLHEYHKAVRDFKPTNSTWALSSRKLGANEIICHGDFGPWNTVWQDDKPVGIVDWDFAGPAKPVYDVAYALEYVAPFRDDEQCLKWLAYSEVPDRKSRTNIFAKAYGLEDRDNLVDEVIKVQQQGIEDVLSLAEKGQQPQVQWVEDGYLDELKKRVEWSKNNRDLFE